MKGVTRVSIPPDWGTMGGAAIGKVGLGRFTNIGRRGWVVSRGEDRARRSSSRRPLVSQMHRRPSSPASVCGAATGWRG